MRIIPGGGGNDGGAAPQKAAGKSRKIFRSPVRRVAAIDIGSNSIRQVIADVTPTGAIRVVDEMKSAPRLGAGLAANSEMTPESMEHAAEAIARMATLARQLGATRIDAVATSAVREATNSRLFLELVRARADVGVRILSGKEEARLCFLSASAHFDMANGKSVVLDIGGGSLEVALSADGVVEHLVSLPLGAIRATEEYLGETPRNRDIGNLRETTRDLLREALPAKDWRGAQCIGSGGTFTNLAGIYLARNNVRIARSVHGTHVPRAEVEHILEHLASLSSAQRLLTPGLNAARADIIVGGLTVAAEALAYFRSRGVLSSGYGIREGLLLNIARVTPEQSNPGRARERSLLEFARRCHFEERHARHVRLLALRLFDAMGKRLGCDRNDRQLLGEAALLHEVGYHIAYNKHHKHSYHLIMHAEILGITPEEQVIIANVARYHRGRLPSKKQSTFGSLDREVRERILRLSALLRLADGLERGHSGVVENVVIRWMERAVRITPVARDGEEHGLRLAAWGASRKGDLLARLAGIPVEVLAPGGEVFSTVDSDNNSVELVN